MADDKIEKAFEAAAAIAKKVPENLQETAFNRALDHILGVRPTEQPRPVVGSRRMGSRDQPNETADWIDAIDRTRYPDIGDTSRVADQSLKVLHLAQAEHGVDGLTSSQIARILTNKFRLRVTPNAVAMALQRESGTVNSRQTSAGVVFQLMAPGERYLNELRSKNTDTTSTGKTARRPRATRRTTKSAEPSTSPPAKRGDPNAPKRPGRPGPKAAVVQLLASGFFDSPRTISDIQGELKHKRGHGYTLQELSPALVRSLRDETLDRTRKDNGQYEYFKA